MTIREVYQWGTEQLSSAGIEEAALDAWYLLEFVTEISRAAFLADSRNVMEKSKEEQYRKVIAKRAKRIPLQHITGVQEFMGLEFDVNEHVLIPRQDTEVLVETALERLKQKFQEDVEQRTGSVEILDMCTGSGCILLSMLYYVRQEYEKNLAEIRGLGVDVSKEALQVACRNAKKLKIDAEWMESDLFSEVKGTYHLILSNPPYIPSAVIEGLQPEVREHDPRLALDGKEDGLYFYRIIIEESRKYLKPGGQLLFEIGAEQGQAVSDYMKQCGYTEVAIKKDLAGLDRVVSGVYDTCERKEARKRKELEACLTD